MTTIKPSPHLDIFGVAACVKAEHAAPLRFDLSRCSFVTPAGLVFLGVAMEGGRAVGRPMEFTIDPTTDTAKYLERMGLGEVMERCGFPAGVLPAVTHHPPADRFLELTRFALEGDSVTEDVCRTLVARVKPWQIDTKRLHDSVFELASNVDYHAGATGLVAVQHYPKSREVEFAVGDHGVGIPAALASAGHEFTDPGAAIRAAVETNVTSSGDSFRGKGLPGLHHHVCDVLAGVLVVQAGGYRVTYRPGTTPVTIQLPYRQPGTLAFGRFRTG